VQAWIQEGDITLEKAAGKVTASAHRGNLNCALQGQTAQVELLTEGGNVTVIVPASFGGILYLYQEQNDQQKGAYLLKSDFDLGLVKAEPVKGPQGQTFAIVTQLQKSIGTGTGVIHIRAVNGNVTIAKK
jgi:DUF4097 and DUF4098 domain-containing protein YvlB